MFYKKKKKSFHDYVLILDKNNAKFLEYRIAVMNVTSSLASCGYWVYVAAKITALMHKYRDVWAAATFA